MLFVAGDRRRDLQASVVFCHRCATDGMQAFPLASPVGAILSVFNNIVGSIYGAKTIGQFQWGRLLRQV